MAVGQLVVAVPNAVNHHKIAGAVLCRGVEGNAADAAGLTSRSRIEKHLNPVPLLN
jgi:hypothetical protein